MAVKRSTVSFQTPVWDQLIGFKNKSQVVNEALKLYFALDRFKAEKNLEYNEAETAFVLQELAHFDATQEQYSHEEVFNRKL